MDRIKINGGIPINGSIQISGAKNATLPLMAASLLTADTIALANVPKLADITTMANLLIQLGASLNVSSCNSSLAATSKVILLSAANIHKKVAPYDIVRKMRASIWVLGPLLARFGEAEVSLPGGCAIGNRPIDLHLSAFAAMGVEIQLVNGYIKAKIQGRLKGAEIYFNKISVGATINVMMAATLADGVTNLYNAAKEPEISELAKCLQSMGAEIYGIGTSTITIHGVKELHGAHHQIIADRIEAGTYAIAAAITGGNIELLNINLDLIDHITEKLVQTGSIVEPTERGIRIIGNNIDIKPIDITTHPYPGFPTDMQAQFMALMSISKGASIITETIYENRFMHASEMSRMGANIVINGNSAIVRGVNELVGAEVMATDLRASVSLVLAALAAKGETIINRVYHIDRGYERIEEKLTLCGAEITRIS